MSKDGKAFPFTVEGKELSLPEQKVRAKEILELAIVRGITDSPIDALTLKSEKRKYTLEDEVDLAVENKFTLGVRVYEFEVNGQKFEFKAELESKFELLSAKDIIEMAQKKGVPLPAAPNDCLLQSLGGEEREFKGDDWVDLAKFNKFVILSTNPTPVA